MPKQRNRKRGYLNTAQKALKVALMTKQLLNVEHKHIDTAPSSLTCDTTGGVVALHGCSEGSTSFERNGLSIRTKSIAMHLKFIINAASTTPQTVRIFLFKDKQPNGTTPSITDVLESVETVSLMNNENTTRFTVLRNWVVDLSPNGKEIHSESFYKKLNYVTKYIGSTSAATDIGYNALYLGYMSTEAANKPTVRYSARIRYIDN